MRTRPDLPIAGTTQSPHRPGADTSPVITFTARGEAALDELAAALSADLRTGLADDFFGTATPDPGMIAALFDRVLNADLEELCAAVTAAAHAPSITASGIIHDLADAKLAPDRDPHEAQGQTVRAPTISPGDPAPAGRVDGVELHRDLRRVPTTRVQPTTTGPALALGLGLGLGLGAAHHVRKDAHDDQ